MVQTIRIEASSREQAGKGAARATRRGGKVPAVIYGAKQDATLIALDPPSPLPRGTMSRRPFRVGSGSAMNFQFVRPSAIALKARAGMMTSSRLFLPPASSRSTFVDGSALNLLASTQPAEPAPITT